MRRPRYLHSLRLEPYEYKLMGEIVVLASCVEQMFKDLPLILGAIKTPAFTAHLNMQSLTDLNLAILPDFVRTVRLREQLKAAIIKCQVAYDDRSKLVHGFFWPSETNKSTFRISFRRKFAATGYVFNRDTLRNQLAELIEAYNGLSECIGAFETLKELGKEPGGSFLRAE